MSERYSLSWRRVIGFSILPVAVFALVAMQFVFQATATLRQSRDATLTSTPMTISATWGTLPSPSPTAIPTPTITPVPTATPTPRPIPSPMVAPVSSRQAALVTRVIDGDTIEVEPVLSHALSRSPERSEGAIEGEAEETILPEPPRGVEGVEGQRHKVRYIGIDAPETRHPQKPEECFGHEAAEKNRGLVEGKAVYLEKDVSETDRYGRLLRYVFLQDGTFVNAELVRLGYAQVATFPPDVRYADLFLRLQREAREARRGLWGQCR